jgi:hypothetical protein
MVLWLLELTGGFLVAWFLLNTDSGHPTMAAIGVAAVLAGSAVLTSFAIGLYRAETFLRLRRLISKTLLACLLSFSAI